MSTLDGFHHVALTVRDCAASTRWYQDVLDLRMMFEERNDDRRSSILGFPSGGYAVSLVEHRSSGGESFDPLATGLDHVAVTVADATAMEGWAARLDERGIEHSGVIEVAVGLILNFRDPDGIALALFADAAPG